MPTMATDQFSSTPSARSIWAMRNAGVVARAPGAERAEQREVLADLRRVHACQLGQLLGGDRRGAGADQLGQDALVDRAGAAPSPRGSASPGPPRRRRRTAVPCPARRSLRRMVPRTLPAAPNRSRCRVSSPGEDEQLPGHDVEPAGGRRLAGHHGQVPVGVDQEAELAWLQVPEGVDAAQRTPSGTSECGRPSRYSLPDSIRAASSMLPTERDTRPPARRPPWPPAAGCRSGRPRSPRRAGRSGRRAAGPARRRHR